MKNLYSLLAFAVLLLTASFKAQAQNIIFWEEFDGSANGWTSEPVSPLDSSFWNWADNKWAWSATGAVNTGAFFNVAVDPTIQSETVANGSMTFNADFYTTQGINTNVPPGPPYVPYLCHLVSPNIDLSGATNALQLEFSQFLRFLNVTTGAPGGFRASVSWTTDNGTTWSAPFNCGDGQNVNAYGANDAVITVPMTGVQGSPDFRLRFTFSSDFYFWAIDDIKILERPAHDMQANSNWFAIAPNALWPASQVEPFGFLCDISNIGSQDQTGVNLNISVVDDATSNVVYSADQAYGTIEVDSVAENVSFGTFTPAASPATYTATYTVSADSTDLNPDNNSIEFAFAVTDTTFAKEALPTSNVYPATANWDVDEPRSWAWGNYYYVPNGDGWYANTASFSIHIPSGSTAAGQTVQVVLYEWEDTNADEFADPGERTSIGTYLHVIGGAETFDQVITVPLTNIFTGLTPELTDDTQYILAMEFNAEDDTQVRFGASVDYDYGAMQLGTMQQGAPRYADFLGINGNLDEEPYSPFGFSTPFVPIVRLNIGQTPLYSNTKELLNPAEIVKISPNPANEFVQFDVKLKETSSQIRLELLDLTGKSISVQEFQNLKDVYASFNTVNLPNGTYFVRIDTDFGYTTERFVVQK